MTKTQQTSDQDLNSIVSI